MQHYYECLDEINNKFWYIDQKDNLYTVLYGEIGTEGQKHTKTFASQEEAEKEAIKIIKSKIKKGYQEKTIPATLLPAISRLSQIIKMPDAPKPKYHPKPIPPNDVIDDGKEKPWFDLDEWADEGEPNPFDFEELRKTNISNTSNSTNSRNINEFKNLKNKVQIHIEEGNRFGYQFEVVATLDRLKALSSSEKEFQNLIKEFLEMIFSDSDSIWRVCPIHLQLLAYLLPLKEANIMVKGKNAQGVLKYLFSHNPSDLNMINMLIEEYFKGLCENISAQIIHFLKEIVNCIRSGGKGNIPPYKLSKKSYGFGIKIENFRDSGIYNLVHKNDPTCYAQFSLDTQNHESKLIIKYLTPILKHKLETMLNEGFFDGLATNYFKITFIGEIEPLIEKRINESYLKEQLEKIDEYLQQLEKSDLYDVTLLSILLRKYLDTSCLIQKSFTDRILALLKKYLYSGDEGIEHHTWSLIPTYGYSQTDFANELKLISAQYLWENCRYDHALMEINELVQRGYLPAIYQKRAWEKKFITDGYNYYNYANQSEIMYDYESLIEQDIFCETDAIIARAMPDGNIYLRFKSESEQAYSEALDYLNSLMAKGYSKIFEGYWLRIYFVAKPQFYSAFNNIIEEYPALASDSHAFFRKAAMYESLHDKIREFIELTMEKFHHCLDLQDEDNSVAGTFAAIALAMTDVKHMDMAIKFALETDDEHEFLASYFGKILQRHWGITPETAVAIALLQLSYQEQPNLSSQFYKIPQNLAALTDYFNSDDIPHKSRKIITLVSSLFGNEKYSLKKLKELFSDATDPLAKEIYADFHNLVLDALKEEGEASGQPIIYNISPKPKSDSEPLIIDEQDFIENPTCIITPLQAKKRGFDVGELQTYDSPWRAIIFAPLTITNPYIFDAIIQFHKVQNNIGVRSVIIWGTEQAYCFGKKVVIDFSGTPYQVGMGIYGKNQAQLIYGVMDFAKIAVAMNKQAPDKEKLFALRKQYYYFDSPKGSPNIDKSKPGIMYLDEALVAGIYNDNNYRAIKQLEKITPDMGEVYDTSLLFRAYMMQKKQDYAMEKLQRKLDTTELKQVYQTAQKRLPQYQEYWQEKLAKL